MATPNSSFGCGIGDGGGFRSPEYLPSIPYDHMDDAGVVKTNSRFVQSLIASIHQICQASLGFRNIVKISGSLLFNLDGSQLDVLEINETIRRSNNGNLPSITQKVEILETVESRSNNGDLGGDAYSMSRSGGVSPEFQVRPRIDAEVQTEEVSAFWVSENLHSKNYVFVNTHGQSEDHNHPAVYPRPTDDVRPQPVTLTGLQKLTGANRRKKQMTRKLPVERSITTPDPCSVQTAWQSVVKDSTSEPEPPTGMRDDPTDEEVTASEPDDDDKADPDFCPDTMDSGDQVINLTPKEEFTASEPEDDEKADPDYSSDMDGGNLVISLTPPKASGVKRKRGRPPKLDKLNSKVTTTKGKLKLKISKAKLKKGKGKMKTFKTKAEKKEYSCPDCSFVSGNLRKLIAHQRATHKSGGIICPECDKLFSCNMTLRRHLSSVHEKIRHVCEICGRSFTSPNSLYHHKRGEHSAIRPFKCKQCQKSFKFHHSFKLHMLQHSGVRPHKCPHCEKTYLTANHLKQHVQVVHAQARDHSCQTCGKRFGYLNSLRVHEKLHTSERPYQCPICQKGFINVGALKAHEGRHIEWKNFECDECGKFYKTEFLLKIHKRRHTPAVSRFMCDVCGLRFMFKSNLEIHKAVHSDTKNFQCTTCGKAFKTYPTLYSHQQCHIQDSRFSCSICHKMFKTKARCGAHEKRHTEQKKHPCSSCQKMFSSKGDLSKHKRTVHGNTKRYSCPMCGKPSARSDNLRVHLIRVHGKDPKEVNMGLLSSCMEAEVESSEPIRDESDSPHEVTEATGHAHVESENQTHDSQTPHPTSLYAHGESGLGPHTLPTMAQMPHHSISPHQIPPMAHHMEDPAYQHYMATLQAPGLASYSHWFHNT